MKYVKMLCLFTLASVVSTTFAASASADELTSSPNTTATSIHGTTEGHTAWDMPSGTLECDSTFTGKVTQQGAGVDIKGNITTLDFTGCTGKTVTVLKGGTFTIDVTATNVATLVISGAQVSIVDHNLGIECIYTTSNTHIGTVTGSSASNATADIDSAAIPRTGGSFFCGGSGEWTGSYKITSPSALHLDAS